MLLAALVWWTPLVASADSLVLGEYLPKAQAMYNSMGCYSTVQYTATSSTTGHLLAQANAYCYTDAAGHQSMEKSGSTVANFTIDVDLTNVEGTIGFVANSANNKLSITDGSHVLQFYSAKLLAFEFTTDGQFKLRWEKDGGAAALASALPFIGAIIYPKSSVPDSFRTSNASFTPIQANSDVFMTPVPQAGFGGIVLLVGATCCGFARSRRVVR